MTEQSRDPEFEKTTDRDVTTRRPQIGRCRAFSAFPQNRPSDQHHDQKDQQGPPEVIVTGIRVGFVRLLFWWFICWRFVLDRLVLGRYVAVQPGMLMTRPQAQSLRDIQFSLPYSISVTHSRAETPPAVTLKVRIMKV